MTNADMLETRISRHNNLDKVAQRGWTLVDGPGEFAMISKHSLAIDKSYQRDTSEGRILAISKQWSWIACNTLSVALRPDGDWYVFDGQNRLGAAMRRDDVDLLPCMVYEMENLSSEAKGFLAINTNRRPMSMVQRFRALLISGDPAAVKVNVMLVGSGVELTEGTANIGMETRRRRVSCAGTLLRYMETKEEILRAVWPIAVAAAHDDFITQYVLEALVYAEENLADGKTLTDPRWKNRMVSIGLARIKAGIARAVAIEGRFNQRAAASGILHALNSGTRGDRLELRS